MGTTKLSEKKNRIRKYLWEFLLVFLAVFCGFWADKIRENSEDTKKAKKYIRSISRDLALDTAWMNHYISDQQASIRYFDSVIFLLKKGMTDSLSRKKIYYMTRMGIKMSSPNKLNYSAYDQMRNSGNLRLIKNQTVLDSISRYYFGAKDIEQLNETIMQRQSALVEFEGKIFDATVFRQMLDTQHFTIHMPAGNPALITTDKILINDFMVRAHYLSSANVYSLVYARRQKKDAISLIQFLKKKYCLK